ncbi:MAG: CaiB/BaiF CoA transferase family protein [Acidimicrobiales bacterium]
MHDRFDPAELSWLDEGATGPLAGVHVLDISRIVAAPFAAMALGELGATVIKVERPKGGDDSRTWGPPFVMGESAYYLSVNRNKVGIALDFSKREGAELCRSLAVDWADVLVENFRDGVLKRWDLDLADLRAANPRLITSTIRGYPVGDSRPGVDFIIQGSSGIMSLIGPGDGNFYKVGAPIADLTAGLYLVSGVLAALHERNSSGLGQHLSVSLWESLVSLLVNANQGYLLTGNVPRALGNAHPQVAPYDVFDAVDGQLTIGAVLDHHFESLAGLLGHREWLSEARYANNAARVLHRGELKEEINASIAGWKRSDLLGRLIEASIPCGPLRTIDEVMSSDEAVDSQIVVSVEHRKLGPLPMVRLPWCLSRTATASRLAPPMIGEHTHQVLSSMGLNDEEIEWLRAQGILAVNDTTKEPKEQS